MCQKRIFAVTQSLMPSTNMAFQRYLVEQTHSSKFVYSPIRKTAIHENRSLKFAYDADYYLLLFGFWCMRRRLSKPMPRRCYSKEFMSIEVFVWISVCVRVWCCLFLGGIHWPGLSWIQTNKNTDIYDTCVRRTIPLFSVCVCERILLRIISCCSTKRQN